MAHNLPKPVVGSTGGSITWKENKIDRLCSNYDKRTGELIRHTCEYTRSRRNVNGLCPFVHPSDPRWLQLGGGLSQPPSAPVKLGPPLRRPFPSINKPPQQPERQPPLTTQLPSGPGASIVSPISQISRTVDPWGTKVEPSANTSWASPSAPPSDSWGFTLGGDWGASLGNPNCCPQPTATPSQAWPTPAAPEPERPTSEVRSTLAAPPMPPSASSSSIGNIETSQSPSGSIRSAPPVRRRFSPVNKPPQQPERPPPLTTQLPSGPGASIVSPMPQISGTVDPWETKVGPSANSAWGKNGSSPSAPSWSFVSDEDWGPQPTATDLMDLTDDVGPAISSISANPVRINGHFCDLFEGWHSAAGKVALKRPRIGATGYDDVIMRRFEREAATWRKLRHPHILEFLGTFKRGGHVYFVSPFIENGTLVEYIADYPNVNRIQLMCQTADAVQYLHKERIVHGDLKANNILIHDDGYCLLCDFGLTKTNDSRTSTAMKGAGTLRWQSPELWDSAPKTFESDVYAFSMTIVEALTGKAPFAHHANDGAVLNAVLQRDERPSKIPNESSNEISYEVIWEVAAACWPRNPADRLSMSEALKRIRADPSLIQNPTL